MSYKCPKCGMVSEQAGNCTMCNVAMEEVKEETAAQAPELSRPVTAPVEEPKAEEPKKEETTPAL